MPSHSPWRSTRHLEAYEWVLGQPESQLSRAPVALLEHELVGRVPTPADLERQDPGEHQQESGLRYEVLGEEATQRLFPAKEKTGEAEPDQPAARPARRRRVSAKQEPSVG